MFTWEVAKKVVNRKVGRSWGQSLDGFRPGGTSTRHEDVEVRTLWVYDGKDEFLLKKELHPATEVTEEMVASLVKSHQEKKAFRRKQDEKREQRSKRVAREVEKIRAAGGSLPQSEVSFDHSRMICIGNTVYELGTESAREANRASLKRERKVRSAVEELLEEKPEQFRTLLDGLTEYEEVKEKLREAFDMEEGQDLNWTAEIVSHWWNFQIY